ncbi:hypothetical protein V5O48_008161, partial [Marasmius crinis-equi]
PIATPTATPDVAPTVAPIVVPTAGPTTTSTVTPTVASTPVNASTIPFAVPDGIPSATTPTRTSTLPIETPSSTTAERGSQSPAAPLTPSASTTSVVPQIDLAANAFTLAHTPAATLATLESSTGVGNRRRRSESLEVESMLTVPALRRVRTTADEQHEDIHRTSAAVPTRPTTPALVPTRPATPVSPLANITNQRTGTPRATFLESPISGIDSVDTGRLMVPASQPIRPLPRRAGAVANLATAAPIATPASGFMAEDGEEFTEILNDNIVVNDNRNWRLKVASHITVPETVVVDGIEQTRSVQVAVPNDNISRSLVSYFKGRVLGTYSSVRDLAAGVTINGSSLPLRYLLSRFNSDMWLGNGLGNGVMRTILANLWEYIFKTDTVFWCAGTEEFLTINLGLWITSDNLVKAEVYGILAAVYMAQIGELPRNLSPALLLATRNGETSVRDIDFIRKFSPSFAKVMDTVWPNDSSVPNLTLAADQSNQYEVESMSMILSELQISRGDIHSLSVDDLRAIRRRIISMQLLGTSHAGVDFDTNRLVQKFRKGMDIPLSDSVAPIYFLEVMGDACKSLLIEMTPNTITSAAPLIRRIEWISSRSHQPGDLTEIEQHFRAIFEAWIAKPGHPDHPNVIERIGMEAFEALRGCAYFRARSFSRLVTGTETLGKDYTIKFLAPHGQGPSGSPFFTHTCLTTVDVTITPTMREDIQRSLDTPLNTASVMELALHDYFCPLDDTEGMDVYNRR